MTLTIILGIIFILFLGVLFYVKSLYEEYTFNKEFVNRILNMKNFSKRENYIIVLADENNENGGYYLYQKSLLEISFFLTVPTLRWLPVRISDDCSFMVYESYLARSLEEAERINNSGDCFKYSS